jgi:hypothetical protein
MRRRFLSASNFLGRVCAGFDDRSRLLLISPLTEVAWADGRVTARESDAIIEVADHYSLTKFEDSFCELMESLMTRSTPTESSRNWFRISQTLSKLATPAVEKISEAMTAQARFVAEMSSNNLIAILRGDGVGRDEESALCAMSSKLRKIESAVALDAARHEASFESSGVSDCDWNGVDVVPIVSTSYSHFDETAVAVA